MNGILVFLGGGLGSVARWLASILMAERMGHAFPWGTLLVNVTGSFLIGLAAAVFGPEGRWTFSANGRVFVMIGICGGYTTFSSFSLQTVELVQAGQWLRAGSNVVFSVGLCLLGVWLGHAMGALLNAGKSAG